MKLETEKGWTEAIIDHDCGYEKFYTIADLLINNFKLVTQLGGEVIKLENENIVDAMLQIVDEKNITTVCIGKPHFNLFKVIMATTIFRRLLNSLSKSNVDLVILS